jgi:anti-sigma B factor antagonist
VTTEFSELPEAGLPLAVEAPRSGCRLIAASGEIDAHTAPQLRACIHGVIAEGGVDQLVIDLSGATFLDSSALGVLVGALKRMRELEGRLDIVLPSSPLRRIFEITALDSVLVLHETRGSALASAVA